MRGFQTVTVIDWALIYCALYLDTCWIAKNEKWGFALRSKKGGRLTSAVRVTVVTLGTALAALAVVVATAEASAVGVAGGVSCPRPLAPTLWEGSERAAGRGG